MDTFDVGVWYPDGARERVMDVDVVVSDQGQLRMYRTGPTGSRKHLGTWPFASIRKWKILDDDDHDL